MAAKRMRKDCKGHKCCTLTLRTFAIKWTFETISKCKFELFNIPYLVAFINSSFDLSFSTIFGF